MVDLELTELGCTVMLIIALMLVVGLVLLLFTLVARPHIETELFVPGIALVGISLLGLALITVYPTIVFEGNSEEHYEVQGKFNGSYEEAVAYYESKNTVAKRPVNLQGLERYRKAFYVWDANSTEEEWNEIRKVHTTFVDFTIYVAHRADKVLFEEGTK